ncbi:helix-turn-helix domain-containing protein [Micromonospora sp. DR5-3]|uniref:helix-turn-helix domain-containing protein n=1 Tax=unclassified Micromonospora TaxID=2617518 RepID=UPI0011D5EF8C|nr:MULTISPECIES: helix-turn-helix domain-containing protein [unclassified Micromonospora]MCW3819527.1 helix-turn-helix domain-containing protein [Micromonospora sp. DR5-3]TYC12064.1 hypothetical protein FXF52_40290 [Micromonospora sp. MP36]
MAVRIDPSWWTSGRWEGRPIREFLEQRDVAAVFRFLHARGVSYGAIATLVGVSANRAAEIAKGTRQVTAYEVLERIAVGLGIPRAAMGLGHERDLDAGTGGLTVTPHGLASGQPTSGPAVGIAAGAVALARLRAELDEALSSSSVSPRQLELIEESASEYMRIYPSAPPSVMLSRLAAECSEVQVLSRRRQPAAVQARLSAAAALLATMCADALMRLGDASEARLWYRTAIHAADDSADTRLRVLVRAQAAMLPYYFGDPQQTVAMADAALAIAAATSSSGALAAAGRARALARLGAAEQARAAIEQARRMFDEAGDDDSDAAFRFPAKRLLFYLSGAMTWLGDTKEAYRVQDEALRLYGPAPMVLIDPALIMLDRALCLVRDLRFVDAAIAAREAIASLPELQCTEIILAKAGQVISAVPRHAQCREVIELAEYVRSCRERGRTLAAGTAALET